MTHDPNRNRMFTEDLGTSNQGCKCQTKWLVKWEDGEITNKDLLTDSPSHLRSLQKNLDSGTFEELFDGSVRYTKRADEWPYGDDFEDTIDVVTVNGTSYYKDPCSFVSEMVWIAEDELKNQLASRGNGFYIVVQESACYTTYGYDGNEAESDYIVLVLNDKPISADDIDSVDLDTYEVE